MDTMQIYVTINVMCACNICVIYATYLLSCRCDVVVCCSVKAQGSDYINFFDNYIWLKFGREQH